MKRGNCTRKNYKCDLKWKAEKQDSLDEGRWEGMETKVQSVSIFSCYFAWEHYKVTPHWHSKYSDRKFWDYVMFVSESK